LRRSSNARSSKRSPASNFQAEKLPIRLPDKRGCHQVTQRGQIIGELSQL